MVQYLGAASALFLSTLILIATLRQRTTRKIQKTTLLIAILLLISAILSNILITIYIKLPNQGDVNIISQATVLIKRLQASFDFLFGIAIGAFVLVTATPGLNSKSDFIKAISEEFPSSYIMYVFIMAVAVISALITPASVTFPNWPSTDPTIINFPMWFLFISGITTAAIFVYVPVKLVTFVRRAKPTSEVVRDTYLIILGIVGYAMSELVFEVLLSFVAIDLRGPGFIVEIILVGMVAFAVRERVFLQELIVPVAEANLKTEITYNLDRGYSYVIMEEEAVHSFEIFKDLVTHGAQGLCITRKSPRTVALEFGLEKTPILWLTRVANQKNSVRPSPPENVAMAIQHFVKIGKDRSLILLDGLEYMISHNDFSSILALLHDLNEHVALNDSILLVPLDPKALTEKEFALLKRDLRVLATPELQVRPDSEQETEERLGKRLRA